MRILSCSLGIVTGKMAARRDNGAVTDILTSISVSIRHSGEVTFTPSRSLALATSPSRER
jgi:hypothetical protein